MRWIANHLRQNQIDCFIMVHQRVIIMVRYIPVISCYISCNHGGFTNTHLLVLSREWMGLGEWDDYY